MGATPYYSEAGITIYHGDCREILPRLRRDLAIVGDPPYGMSLGKISGIGRSKATRALDDYSVLGDGEPFDPSHLLGYPAIILWGGNHYAGRLPSARKWLVWDKREGGTSDDQADCELAWTNLAGPERLFAHRWRGMIKASERDERRVHPTQKPVALMAWCIGHVPDELQVCDPYMGSGTTLRAAKDLGRRAIGIELEERYCEIAANRLRQGVLNFSNGGERVAG